MKFAACPLEKQRVFRKFKLYGKAAAYCPPDIEGNKCKTGIFGGCGLDYLTLARAAGTLSGGEAQRIRLATQIGSGLMGVIYILDEPSIGLHQRDNDRLLRSLKKLRDLGNTCWWLNMMRIQCMRRITLLIWDRVREATEDK